MTLTETKLPLWALEQDNTCRLDERIAMFKQHHGHPPDDDSTLAEWWDVTHTVGDRLWAVGGALPRAYPGERRGLFRVVVRTAYLAACRAQPTVAADPTADPDPAAALALVRGWLDGEAVSGADLRNAARGLAHSGYTNTRFGPGAADAAMSTAQAAGEMAVISARPWADAAANATYHAIVAAYAAASVLAQAAGAASHADAWAAEHAQQRADLDRLLLLELNLEEPCPKP